MFSDTSCRKGYRKDLNTNTCVDIDECATNDNDCNPEEQVCFNTDGKYVEYKDL